MNKRIDKPQDDTLSLIGFLLFILVSLWILLCSLYYEGILTMIVVAGFLILAYRILSFALFSAVLAGLWLVSAVVICVLSIYIAGSYSYLRDIGSFLFAFGIAAFLVHRFGYRSDDEKGVYHQCTKGWRGFGLCVASVAIFWSSCSLLDSLFESGHAIEAPNRSRFESIEGAALHSEKKIGVALSGGGYRAALMHAGVLNALESRHVPIATIATVSGGSIIGSFYAAGGTPHTFRQMLAERRFNLRRDLFDMQNAIRLLSPMKIPLTNTRLVPFGDFGRSDVQSNLIDRILLKGITMSELNTSPGAPKLIMGSTDLLTGDSVGVSADGLFVRSFVQPVEKDVFKNIGKDGPISPDKPEGDSIDPEMSLIHSRRADKPLTDSTLLDLDLIFEAKTYSTSDEPRWRARGFTGAKLKDARLSRFVTASGAFPAAFDAVTWAPTPYHKFLLADGGLSDNSGINLLLNANEVGREDYKSELILSSDASAFFEYPEQIESSLDQIARSIDVVYANTGVRRYNDDAARRPIVLLSPSIFFPRLSYQSRTVGSGFAAYRHPQNATDFILSYFRYKLEFEPEDFDDIDLLVSSLPASPMQVAAAEELQDLRANGYIQDRRIYPRAGSGEEVKRSIDTTLKAISDLENLKANLDAKSSAGPRAGSGEEGKRSINESLNTIRVLENLKSNRDPKSFAGTRPVRDEAAIRNLRNSLYFLRTSLLQDAASEINYALETDIKYCMAAFLRTSTLDDQLNEDDVNAIFRLGQYLVILNWPSIRREMQEPVDATMK